MLTISTRVRYGTRALLRLAKNNPGEPVALHIIAEEEGISKKYLESIFHSLRNAGVVHSTRGPEGGYRLIKSPDQLNVKEIIEAIDGPLNTVACVNNPSFCSRYPQCGTAELWSSLLETNTTFLEKTTLTDLLQKEQQQGA